MIAAIRRFIFPSGSHKMGTLMGVFLPNILQMLGVILFMRLSWILGHVGIAQMSIIILLSSSLLLITSLSLSVTLSNMKMEGGGSYYLISRTLGIEFGSAIGILISISQLVSIALCITGFSLSLHEFFPEIPIHILEIITLTLLMGISFLSTELAVRTQFLIFLILIAALGSIFMGGGTYIPQTITPLEHLGDNLTFWTAFAFFFPVTTGIEAGLSMSGDLKKPSRSLQIGTIASILIAFFVYINLAFFFWKEVPSELLRSYPFIVHHVSKYGELVLYGVWGATLSSALGSIMSGPRIIEAIAADGIMPRFLKKASYNNIFMYLTIAILLLATDINHILPILTMTCLMTYALINFVTFFEELIHNPSYRPTLRIPRIVPFIGFIGCLIGMFMINAGAAILVLGLTLALCIWTSSRKIHGNFDDLRYSLFHYMIHQGISALSHIEKNAKSWRPHILSIIAEGTLDKNLAFFSHALNQEKGFLTFGVSVRDNTSDLPTLVRNDLQLYKIPSYVHVNTTFHIEHGPHEILANYGLGPLKPNTTLRMFELSPTLGLATFLIESCLYRKNSILLKANPCSQAFTQKGEYVKQINLWWGGEYRGNFELCLALSHLLQMSILWSNAKICIKTVVKNEEMREKKELQFQRFSEKLRLQHLSFFPIVDETHSFFHVLQNESSDADLTFLGLRSPHENETGEEYQMYLSTLMKQTGPVTNIAYVLSGESLEFEKIFFQ